MREARVPVTVLGSLPVVRGWVSYGGLFGLEPLAREGSDVAFGERL